MPRSKFFKNQTPPVRQGGDISSLLSGTPYGGSSAMSTASAARKGDEVDSYTLYNYLAVTRIAMRASQQFPMVGLVENKKKIKPSSKDDNSIQLNLNERKWLQSNYGGRIVQSALHQEVTLLGDDHPLVALFHHVNEDDWWESFLFELVMFLELTGEAYVWMVPSKLKTKNAPHGLPSQLVVIPTQWVEQPVDSKGNISSYRVNFPGKGREVRDIPKRDILLIKFKNPRSKTHGYSPGSAGGPWIDASNAIEESRVRTFGNAIVPSVWLKVQEGSGIGPKDWENLDRLKERWIQRAAGLDRWREPQVLPQGIDVDASGNLTPKEMEFHNSAPQIRDDILALRGVNKFVAGYTESMNRAQVETAMTHFSILVLNPLLRMIAGALQEKLAPKYDKRIRIWFPDTTPANREQQLSEARFLFSIGGLTPNEGRRTFSDFGLDAVDSENYRQGYISAGLVPLADADWRSDMDGDGKPDDKDNGDKEDKEEEEHASFLAGLEIYSANGNGSTTPSSNGNGHHNGNDRPLSEPILIAQPQRGSDEPLPGNSIRFADTDPGDNGRAD